jgi:hypothetical protein
MDSQSATFFLARCAALCPWLCHFAISAENRLEARPEKPFNTLIIKNILDLWREIC